MNIFLYWSFIICLIIYLPSVFLFKYYIDSLSDDIKRYLSKQFQFPWAIWCFSLSLFSLLGMINLGIYLLISTENIFFTPYAIWYHTFIISKMPELLDTFFIVIRSKPLVALQYFHHWATLAIAFYMYQYLCSCTTIYIFMNYCVHFFMYLYFGLYCYIPHHLRIFGTFVNIIQTLQMAIAIILAIYHFTNGKFNCLIEPTTIEYKIGFYFGIIMYIIYLVLFIKLFFERQNRIKKD